LPKVLTLKDIMLPLNNSELDSARARVFAAKKSGGKEERKCAAFGLAKQDGEINTTFNVECINEIHNASDAFKTHIAYQMVKKVTGSKTSSSIKFAAESPTARLRGWIVYFSNLLGGNSLRWEMICGSQSLQKLLILLISMKKNAHYKS
jgi:hypothetical protein